MSLAPILVFVYNRPEHTKNLLESLERCTELKKSKIYFFSDFYKAGNEKEKINVLRVRKIIKKFSEKHKAKIIYNKINKGLYNNVINGINFVFKKNSKAIILEDDLLLSPNFLKFMNISLNKYKKFKNVAQVSGYSYPLSLKNKNAYFLKLTSCWGWGIHRKSWFEFTNFISKKKNVMSIYKNMIKFNKIKRNFNFNESFNYFRILKKQINSSIASWGILFYLFCFVKKKITLFPPYSLVKNLGFDGSGNHKSLSNFFNLKNDFSELNIIKYPRKTIINKCISSKIEFFFRNELSFSAKVKNLINNYV